MSAYGAAHAEQLLKETFGRPPLTVRVNTTRVSPQELIEKFGQQIVETLAEYAGVPVWNGLTNEYHPTQILADFLTIQEHFGELKGKKSEYFTVPLSSLLAESEVRSR